MNDNDFGLAARAWLDDGPTRMSDRAVLSALEQIHTTRQRRALRPTWRSTPVSIFARVAVAAVLVIAVGLVAGNIVRRQPDVSGVGSSPTPSPTAVSTPSPSPSASPAAHVFPALSSTFVSPTNGFTFGYIDRGGLKTAKELWDPVTQPRPDNTGAHDEPFDVVETGYSAVFKGASTVIPDGVSIDAWRECSPVRVCRRSGGGRRLGRVELAVDGGAHAIPVEIEQHDVPIRRSVELRSTFGLNAAQRHAQLQTVTARVAAHELAIWAGRPVHPLGGVVGEAGGFARA